MVEYINALKLLNLSEVSRVTGRSISTLQAYKRGFRRVTRDAARELVEYLRKEADRCLTAAEQLEQTSTSRHKVDWSAAGKKAWQTRRRNQKRREAALKAWRTRRADA